MSTPIEEISSYLATDLGMTEGTDLFVGKMPDTPDQVLVLLPSGGQPPEMELGARGVRFENPGMQVWARSIPEDFLASYGLAYQAWVSLSLVQAPDILGSTGYLWVRPMQSPFLIDRDDNERVITGFNVTIRKEPTA